MDYILKGGKVYIDGRFVKQDILVSSGRIASVSECFGSLPAKTVD